MGKHSEINFVMKKPDIHTEINECASARSLAVNPKNLVYKRFARLLLMQPAFYTFIWAVQTVTSALGCRVAKILSKPEILMLRWLGCSAGVKRAY
ncbi:hypothetical protein [Rivularia sp. UHCC 0363]|uniref:hypothetical protein n=1 Tax=Rivularia sp. UHCC 0363 TaxID=3110244 RepID=UPI002B1F4415|nr:hypothetical protein [Rivularia sp. UHCC 0363]MEA5595664.1 hypothetical protein [Rivularia sp. UHCC 0363]